MSNKYIDTLSSTDTSTVDTSNALEPMAVYELQPALAGYYLPYSSIAGAPTAGTLASNGKRIGDTPYALHQVRLGPSQNRIAWVSASASTAACKVDAITGVNRGSA